MEEQTEDRSSLIVVKCGKYWKVRNGNIYYDCSFTEPFRAENFLKMKENEIAEKKFKKALNKIRKEPDIRKRERKYKKLCQTKKSS